MSSRLKIRERFYESSLATRSKKRAYLPRIVSDLEVAEL